MLEAQQGGADVNISGELIRSLPLTGRREWSDTLQLTPGILSASTDNYGGQVYFVRGSENENHVDADRRRRHRLVQAELAVQLHLHEHRIAWRCPGEDRRRDASSPAAMGMVINMATPTGGDRYKGAASFLISLRSAGTARTTPAASARFLKPIQPDFRSAGRSSVARPGSSCPVAISTATTASAGPSGS